MKSCKNNKKIPLGLAECFCACARSEESGKVGRTLQTPIIIIKKNNFANDFKSKQISFK